MFKQLLKLLTTVTQEKPRPDTPSVQTEGELTEGQLEAIAAGGITLN